MSGRRILLQVTVWRKGKEFVQTFQYGRPVGGMLEAPSRSIKNTGTQIRFKYDAGIFSKDASYDPDTIGKRLRELAFLNSAATLYFTAMKKGEEIRNDTFQYTGGIAEYVQLMTKGSHILHGCIHFKRALDGSEV
jgi:DNA gyrase subunit B